MLNGYIVPVLDTARLTSLGTSATKIFRPVRTGERGLGSERTSAAKRVVLSINRDRDGTTGALDGTLSVWGFDTSNPQNPTGGVLGNSYAQAATATSVRPQVDQVIGDGTTTAFTTAIDLATGDLAAAIAAGSIAVEMPCFALTGSAISTSAAGVITGTGTKFSAGVSNALGGGELAVGDTVVLGGQAGTITSITSDTVAAWDQTAVVSASTVNINTSISRRFRFVVAASAGATGDPEVVEATVSNSKLVLTFKVAPVLQLIAPVSGIEFPAGGSALVPGAAYLATPVQILADGANPFARVGVRSRSVVWAIGTASAAGAISKSQIRLEHATD